MAFAFLALISLTFYIWISASLTFCIWLFVLLINIFLTFSHFGFLRLAFCILTFCSFDSMLIWLFDILLSAILTFCHLLKNNLLFDFYLLSVCRLERTSTNSDGGWPPETRSRRPTIDRKLTQFTYEVCMYFEDLLGLIELTELKVVSYSMHACNQ